MCLSNEKLIEMYQQMVTIRRFEEKVAELFALGVIAGFVHVYIGEEAVAVGTCSNLRDGDTITSTHRGHGHCIAKGADPKLMMAELFGRETGFCRGKGGSMHIADFDIGIVGANGIVGAGLPIATGCGLASQVKETDNVAVAFFGDGASNQGTFHESLNLASIWKLPVVYVCENNLYAVTMHQSVHQNIKDISVRAKAYGIPGVTVDGNDISSVHDAVGKAVKRARKGEGPSLIECRTYRWDGHYVGEPKDLYRSNDEVEEWKTRCPIKRLRKKIIEELKILTEDEVKKIDDEVIREIDEAIEFGKSQPEPAEESTLEDVFAKGGAS